MEENRIWEALALYAEQEAIARINNPLAPKHAPDMLALKQEFFRSIYVRYRKGATPEEQLSRRYLRRELIRMKARLRPTWWRTYLRVPLVNTVYFLRSANRQHARAIRQWTDNIQKEHIQEHNLQSLQEALKKSGFRISIEGSLKRMLDNELPNFHLRYNDPLRNKNTEYVLRFSMIPGSGIYYFQQFEAIARPSIDALLRKEESINRFTVSLEKDLSFSAQEAASIVHQKAVCKQDKGVERWYYLDRRTVHSTQKNRLLTCAFDIEKALHQLPIKEKQRSKTFASLIDGLKAGGQREVTLDLERRAQKCMIEAAPTVGRIHLYDKNNQLIHLSQLQEKEKRKVNMFAHLSSTQLTAVEDNHTLQRVHR